MKELQLTVHVPPDRRLQALAIVEAINTSGRGVVVEDDIYTIAFENGMSAMARRYLPPGAPASSPATTPEPALAMASANAATDGGAPSGGAR